MTSDDDLRDLVAAALRGDGQWDSLSESQKSVWRADADRAIKALRSAVRTGPDVAGFDALQAWCDERASMLGAVDGFGYHSGEEAAYRHVSIEIGKRLAVLPAPAGESVTGWQDIETAPKDGKKVDVWSEKHGRQVDARYNPDEYTFGIPWGWSSPWIARITDATHWQPLPKPPSRKSEAGS